MLVPVTTARKEDKTPNSLLFFLVLSPFLRLFRTCFPILIYFLTCAFNSTGGKKCLLDFRCIPNYTCVAIERRDVIIWCVFGRCSRVYTFTQACIYSPGKGPSPCALFRQVSSSKATCVCNAVPPYLATVVAAAENEIPSLQPHTLLSSGT